MTECQRTKDSMSMGVQSPSVAPADGSAAGSGTGGLTVPPAGNRPSKEETAWLADVERTARSVKRQNQCGANRAVELDADETLRLLATIERLTRTREALSAQLWQWSARYEKTSKLLTDILFHLPPEAVKLEDGRVMVFVDPDPARTLRLIQDALQRAFDQARSSSDETKADALLHPCDCTGYNGGQCYNCLNGFHVGCPYHCTGSAPSPLKASGVCCQRSLETGGQRHDPDCGRGPV